MHCIALCILIYTDCVSTELSTRTQLERLRVQDEMRLNSIRLYITTVNYSVVNNIETHVHTEINMQIIIFTRYIICKEHATCRTDLYAPTFLNQYRKMLTVTLLIFAECLTT